MQLMLEPLFDTKFPIVFHGPPSLTLCVKPRHDFAKATKGITPIAALMYVKKRDQFMSLAILEQIQPVLTDRAITSECKAEGCRSR